MPSFPIGLISDTHGLLRPEALRLLARCGFIAHAGDVGNPDVLSALDAVAPVRAVRGNNDRGAWAEQLPHCAAVTVGGVRILILHDLADLDVNARDYEPQVIVAGHSHRSAVFHRDGILYVNPGSAGPRRFKLPVSLGFLELVEGRPKARIQPIDIG